LTDKTTKQAIGRYSKHKGDRAEREVAKLLGKFFLDDEKSFARFGNEVAGRIPGDVGIFIKDNMPLTLKLWDKFPFSIEIKNREDWDILSLINNPKTSVITEFWNQTEQEAKRFNKIPILILKKRFQPYYCVLLNKKSEFENPKNNFLFSMNNKLFYFFKLEDFIEINKNCKFVTDLKMFLETEKVGG
jgi:hypothetical protein